MIAYFSNENKNPINRITNNNEEEHEAVMAKNFTFL